MAQKFAFLITVDSKGSLNSKAYRKEDTQKGLEDYAKARDEGKEAHFYQHPVADKRCKSEAAYDTLDAATKHSVDKPEPAPASKAVTKPVVKAEAKPASSGDVAIDL
jgi:hypothetical protein